MNKERKINEIKNYFEIYFLILVMIHNKKLKLIE